MAVPALSERNGKVNPFHATPIVARASNSFAQFAGLFDGRYWARTSDPQLVEMVQPFAPVRSGALKTGWLSKFRLRPNA
jgi:hypothetical protein